MAGGVFQCVFGILWGDILCESVLEDHIYCCPIGFLSVWIIDISNGFCNFLRGVAFFFPIGGDGCRPSGKWGRVLLISCWGGFAVGCGVGFGSVVEHFGHGFAGSGFCFRLAALGAIGP